MNKMNEDIQPIRDKYGRVKDFEVKGFSGCEDYLICNERRPRCMFVDQTYMDLCPEKEILKTRGVF